MTGDESPSAGVVHAPTLTDAVDASKRCARKARQDAHSPYSEFNVGAALVVQSADGYRVYRGANVELPGRRGFHAEQVAVANAVIDGAAEFDALAVSCSDRGGHIPCGICLSTLTEFADDLRILVDEGDSWHQTTLREEMPNAYGGHARMKADS